MKRCMNCKFGSYALEQSPCNECSGFDKWKEEVLVLEDADAPIKRQVEGDHYAKLPIQPFQYAMANKLDPLQHTIVKYVTRFRDKNGRVDLEKAIHCIELLIQHEYEGGL